jgi:DNA-directed RNA polymerase subunit L
MELASSSPENLAYGNIRYSIANEYEADYTGYLLLQKAGYDPDLMLVTLEIMNIINQESMKGEGVNANQYFLDHPSPHKRLAKFKSGRQEYHQLASELEKAFDDVQMGINLERAIDFLERAERKFPGNIYICKEIAVARHKLWLTTVSVSDQKLKGILYTPSFRDEMVFKSDRGQSKGADVPGNKKYYEEAYEAYMKIYKKAADPAFHSSVALLLAYSPDKVKRRQALELSYYSAKETGRLDLASNYSVVLFLSGVTEQALEVMTAVASKYDKDYQVAIAKSSKDPIFLKYSESPGKPCHSDRSKQQLCN